MEAKKIGEWVVDGIAAHIPNECEISLDYSSGRDGGAASDSNWYLRNTHGVNVPLDVLKALILNLECEDESIPDDEGFHA